MLSASLTVVSLQNTEDRLGAGKNARQEAIRKTVIVVLLVGSLIPPLLFNLGVASQGRFPNFKQRFGFFRALLLCQQWTLFGYVVPFNFTLNFEVELRDGRIVVLRDLIKDRWGKWQPILFHNERKAQLNLYGNRAAQRHYLEYLIWLNRIDRSEVTRRTVYLRFRDVLPRDKAAAAGKYFGPEKSYVLDRY